MTTNNACGLSLSAERFHSGKFSIFLSFSFIICTVAALAFSLFLGRFLSRSLSPCVGMGRVPLVLEPEPVNVEEIIGESIIPFD